MGIQHCQMHPEEGKQRDNSYDGVLSLCCSMPPIGTKPLSRSNRVPKEPCLKDRQVPYIPPKNLLEQRPLREPTNGPAEVTSVCATLATNKERTSVTRPTWENCFFVIFLSCLKSDSWLKPTPVFTNNARLNVANFI